MKGYSTIQERIKLIADTFYNGNISAMAKSTYISRTTINSIIGEKEVSPGYEVIRRLAETRSLNLSLDWLITGNGEMLKENLQPSGGNNMNTSYTGNFTEPIVANHVMGSGNVIGEANPNSSPKEKKAASAETNTDLIRLMIENEKLKAQIDRLTAHLEMKDTVIENKNIIIEEKERMIKMLLDKK